MGVKSTMHPWSRVPRNLTDDAFNAVRDAILNDATRFPGANIDAAISTRATPTQVRTEVDAEFTERGATAARFANLDNIDASLKELFYEHFAAYVDDFADVSAAGTASSPAYLIDNDLANNASFATVGEYVEIDFKASAYIKQFRYYGYFAHNQNGSYKIQGLVNGSWTDLKTDIPTRLESWSSWIDLTPAATSKIRVVATAIDTCGVNRPREWEFKGVRIG